METVNNKVYLKTFGMMFLGLLATAIIAIFTFKTGIYMNIPLIPIAIGELVVVLILSFALKKLPPIAVTFLYFVYAVLNGMVFGCLFAVYDLGLIGIAFAATSALFIVLTLIGVVLKKDISNWRTVLVAALFVGLIVSIINLFMGSSILEIIIDWVMLGVFAGITIVDVNRIKDGSIYFEQDEEKLYVYYAMNLYLDFINMFLRILSIMSKFSRK